MIYTKSYSGMMAKELGLLTARQEHVPWLQA